MNPPPLLPLVRVTPGQNPHFPAAVRRSFRERAQREICRECRARCQPAPGAPESAELACWHESATASRQWVAAVLYPYPVGIALERVRHRSQALVRAVTDRGELELFGGFRWQNFTRILSAKLAVLRRCGRPLNEFGACRLVAVPGPRGLVVQHDALPCYVHQVYRRGCYASLCAERSDSAELRWDWRETPLAGDFE